jgi:3-oxoacyl-[acyl-carrier-protein] synthase-3
MQRKISIIGIKGVVGSMVLPLDELARKFQTTPEEINKKTGISCLRRWSSSESLVGVAAEAARKVLKNCGKTLGDISGVFASSNPTTETLIPTFAASVANELGLKDVMVNQVGVGCVGGIQALHMAYNQLTVDLFHCDQIVKNYLVIAGDHTSKVLDPDDFTTGIVFSEGVSVLLLTNDLGAEAGYQIVDIGTKSLLGENLRDLSIENPYCLPEKSLPFFTMRGTSVYRFGVSVFSHILNIIGFGEESPNWRHYYFIPHQANLRMITAMANHSGIPMNRVYVDGIKTIGNTSMAAVFLGFEDVVRREIVSEDDMVLFGGFGVELQVGAVLLRPLWFPERILD